MGTSKSYWDRCVFVVTCPAYPLFVRERGSVLSVSESVYRQSGAVLVWGAYLVFTLFTALFGSLPVVSAPLLFINPLVILLVGEGNSWPTETFRLHPVLFKSETKT